RRVGPPGAVGLASEAAQAPARPEEAEAQEAERGQDQTRRHREDSRSASQVYKVMPPKGLAQRTLPNASDRGDPVSVAASHGKSLDRKSERPRGHGKTPATGHRQAFRRDILIQVTARSTSRNRTSGPVSSSPRWYDPPSVRSRRPR